MIKQTPKLLKSIFIVFAILANSAVTAEDSRAIRIDYPATRLAENVYVIYGPVGEPTRTNQGFRNNVVFVVTDTGVVVMDPGTSVYVGQMVLRKIRDVTDKPVVAVFNSHIHGDHWLGNQAFKDANPKVRIYAHANMIKMAKNGEGEHWLKMFNGATDNAVVGTRVVAPDTPVSDGQVITIGGTQFRVLEAGRSHTDGDIMIEMPQKKVLFTGDIVRVGLIGINDLSYKGYLAAIERILRTKSAIYIPGHGKAGDKKIVLTYRNFINTLRSTVAKHYDEGLTDYQVKPYVANALQEYRNWARFEENLGRLVSLTYLEIQEESFK